MVWAWEVGKDPQVILMCRHVWEPLLHVASTIISLNKTHLALSPVLKDLPNLLDQQIKSLPGRSLIRLFGAPGGVPIARAPIVFHFFTPPLIHVCLHSFVQ